MDHKSVQRHLLLTTSCRVNRTTKTFCLDRGLQLRKYIHILKGRQGPSNQRAPRKKKAQETEYVKGKVALLTQQ